MNDVLILHSLQKNGWNQTLTAEHLGVSRQHINRWVKNYSIKRLYKITETESGYYVIFDLTESRFATGKLTLNALGHTLETILKRFPYAVFMWPDLEKTRFNRKTKRWRKVK
jgi:transcriptional regulator with XRE-family HTH domain